MINSPPTLEDYRDPRACITWKGSHRQIPYSVKFFGYDPDNDRSGTWCFYVYLHEAAWRPENFNSFLAPRKIEDEVRLSNRGRKFWDYSKSDLVNLDWHGGITYYKIHNEQPHRAIEAGCDYAHSFDENHSYSLKFVEIEAQECVNSLFILGFTPLVRCSWSGEYGEPKDMIPTTHGGFVLASKREEVPWPEWFSEGVSS